AARRPRRISPEVHVRHRSVARAVATGGRAPRPARTPEAEYGPALADVIERRDALRRELVDLERGDDRIVELERELAAARTTFVSAAETLSNERRRVAVTFGRQLEAVLAELAMERTRFEVRFGD